MIIDTSGNTPTTVCPVCGVEHEICMCYLHGTGIHCPVCYDCNDLGRSHLGYDKDLEVLGIPKSMLIRLA